MNVYFYRYGSLCEPDIIESLIDLGFDVYEETSEIYDKKITPAKGVHLASSKLIDGKYNFVFTINFFPWLSDLCNIMKIVYISLIVDSPVIELFSNSIRNPYNRIFLFDKQLYQDFYNENPECIFHIPLATNIERNCNIINSSSLEVKNKFKSDISFIGSLYTEKCPYNQTKLPAYETGFVNGVMEAQLKVYGYNFIEESINDSLVDMIVKNTPNFYMFPPNYRADYKAVVAQQYISVKVAEMERIAVLNMLSNKYNVDIYTGSDTSCIPNIHNRGFAKSLTEMPLIFNQSKINLNITAKSIRSGLSLRIFDVLGCCGFLITNYQAELPEIFEIGKDLESYASMEELDDKVSYYLTHDSEREKIAQSGFNKIEQFHSYKTRLSEMLEKAFL